MAGNRRLCSESNVSLFVTTEPCLVVSSLDSKRDKTVSKRCHFGGGLYFHEVCDKLGTMTPASPATHRGLPQAVASAPGSPDGVLHPPHPSYLEQSMPGRHTWHFRIRPPSDKPVATVIPTDDHHHYTPPLLPGTGKPVILT